jgi:hypothetical protein
MRVWRRLNIEWLTLMIAIELVIFERTACGGGSVAATT